MQYALLVYGDADATPVPDTPPEASPTWTDYTQALRDAGLLVSGEPLRDIETATTVRWRSGQHLITDGPFAETKEQLMGFYLIDAPDLDVALDWARRMPHLAWGSVEVRPVSPDSPASAAAA